MRKRGALEAKMPILGDPTNQPLADGLLPYMACEPYMPLNLAPS